jgi:hypothetical protein
LYVAVGGSDDYAIDKMGIPYAYTFELGEEKYNFHVPLKVLNTTVAEVI